MKMTTVDPSEHIKSLPEEVREDVQELDTQIARIMSEQPRVLWQGVFWGGSEQNIIGYGHIHYKRPKGNDVEWFIVGLAVQKNYISIYVNAVEDGKYLVEKYATKLGKVKIGKSSISFKHLNEVNIFNLLELIDTARQQMTQAK